MKITAPNYRRTLAKHRKARKGHGWTKLKRIKMDCICGVNLKNVGPPFFKFILVLSKCHLHSPFNKMLEHYLFSCHNDNVKLNERRKTGQYRFEMADLSQHSRQTKHIFCQTYKSTTNTLYVPAFWQRYLKTVSNNFIHRSR